MTPAAPAFRYALERAGEFEMPVLRRGRDSGRLFIFAQPLFEEHNRCRRLFADLGRALADRCIASALPDLPRTGDHADTEPFDLAMARKALAAFIALNEDRDPVLLSLRGGAHLSTVPAPHVALAPVLDGERLLVDLIRSHAVSVREHTGASFGRADADALWKQGATLVMAGHAVSAATAAGLTSGRLIRADLTITLSGADADVPAPSVWRQADPEPTRDAAEAIAERLSAWLNDQ